MKPQIWIKESPKERNDKMEKTMVAVLERDREVNGRPEDVLHNPTLQEENGPQYSPVQRAFFPPNLLTGTTTG